MKRNFVSILDWSSEEIRQSLELSKELKASAKQGNFPKYLENKSYALIFHKFSLRTRVSFEVGITQLGGNSICLTERDFVIGERESVSDVAKVLSRYVDGILIRTYSHDDAVQLAKNSDVPVINMLTDWTHPCQVMADVLTIEEHRGRMDRLKVVYLGDGNNVANSWINMAARLPVNLCIATSPETLPDMGLVEQSRNTGISSIEISHEPFEAVKDADVLYTDVWASMGQKDKAKEKRKNLQQFQINSKLLAHAKPDALVFHCLPAERGREITDEVLDGSHSVVFDQAENRMHVQKAILVQLERWMSLPS
ncbi:ornithine carbamoyltransferase [Deltaproteobacteria bacterium TL4]